MPKNVSAALKAWTFEAKTKATEFGLEAPGGQGLASRTTSLLLQSIRSTLNSRQLIS